MKFTANHGIPAGNPIANALVVIVGALVIGASIVLGFVAFLVLGSIVLILGAIMGLRLWWFNRKLRGSAKASVARPDTGKSGVIEGEYHVVKRDEKP